MGGGVIYGDDDPSVSNTAGLVGEALSSLGTARFGAFNGADNFTPAGYLGTSNFTIRVTGGDLIPPPMGSGLVEQLSWFMAFDPAGDHTVTVIGDETITPQMLMGRDLTITLDGGGNIRLDGHGSLFALDAGVTLVLDDITLTGFNQVTVAQARPLVRVNSGGTLRMNTGSLITGNTNTAAAANAGGGVRVDSGGTFDMHGGTISGNTSTNTGGGVALGTGATFNMHGGTISGNTVTAANGAGGVHLAGTAANPSVFNMHSGATISENIAAGSTSAGGVFLSAAGTTFNMHGGTIADNRANAATGQTTGGVRVANNADAVFNMRSGVIRGNHAVSGGTLASPASGGVTVLAGGVFRISDGTIYGNDAELGVRNSAGPASPVPAMWRAAGATVAQRGTFAGVDGAFVSIADIGSSNLTIRVINGTLDVPEMGDSLVEQLSWIMTFDPAGDHTIAVSGDETIPPQLMTGRGLRITLEGGGNIVLDGHGSLFTLDSGVTLVLQNITLTGFAQTVAADARPLVVVNAGGILRMNADSLLTGHTNNATGANAGGGVRVNSGGVFDMYGGAISGNTVTAASAAGGVFIAGTAANPSVFNMHTGATIFGNNANGATSSGGVFLSSAGTTFNMFGGTISGNRANAATGQTTGGVRVSGNATAIFNMRGGVITDNHATSAGTAAAPASGGVTVLAGGVFRISDGTIYGNEVAEGTRNTAGADSAAQALWRAAGTTIAQRGTFGADGVFVPAGTAAEANIPGGNNTIRVVAGVLQ